MKTVAALSGFLCLGRHFFVIIGILLFSRVVSVPTVEDKEKKERVQGWAGGNGAFDFLFTLGTIETEMREDL